MADGRLRAANCRVLPRQTSPPQPCGPPAAWKPCRAENGRFWKLLAGAASRNLQLEKPGVAAVEDTEAIASAPALGCAKWPSPASPRSRRYRPGLTPENRGEMAPLGEPDFHVIEASE